MPLFWFLRVSFSLKDIIPFLMPTDSLHFNYTPAPVLAHLSPCLLSLSVVSSTFSEPFLTHSPFAPSCCLTPLTTLSHLPQRLHLSLFLLSFRKKRALLNIYAHRVLYSLAHTHLPVLSFCLLPFTLSLLHPSSPGKWISNIYDEAFSELLLLSLLLPLSLLPGA